MNDKVINQNMKKINEGEAHRTEREREREGVMGTERERCRILRCV